MVPDNVQISKLSNGLTLIAIDQPWNQGIYCDAFIRVGSCDEQLAKDKGICHFIEHSVFRGTEDYSEEQIRELTIGRGGYCNAATSYEYTRYAMWTQPKFFTDTISILDNLIFKPNMNNDDLNIEREIIIEEAMQIKSNPFVQCLAKISEILIPEHNASVPIIGTEESIHNITSTRIKEYLRGYYRPQSIILSLCGKLPEQKILEEMLYNHAHGFIRKTRASNSSILKRNFGSFEQPKTEIYGEETWENIQSSTSITSYVFNTQDFNRSDHIAMDILATIIGGDLNSLMYKQIRHQNGLCYSFGAFPSTFSVDNLGLFNFVLLSQKTKIDQADNILDKIIKNIKKGKIEEADIENAKNNLIGSSLRGFENGGVLSSFLSKEYLDENDSLRISPWEYADVIKKVSKSQLAKLAKHILEAPHARYRVLNKND